MEAVYTVVLGKVQRKRTGQYKWPLSFLEREVREVRSSLQRNEKPSGFLEKVGRGTNEKNICIRETEIKYRQRNVHLWDPIEGREVRGGKLTG